MKINCFQSFMNSVIAQYHACHCTSSDLSYPCLLLYINFKCCMQVKFRDTLGVFMMFNPVAQVVMSMTSVV